MHIKPIKVGYIQSKYACNAASINLFIFFIPKAVKLQQIDSELADLANWKSLINIPSKELFERTVLVVWSSQNEMDRIVHGIVLVIYPSV